MRTFSGLASNSPSYTPFYVPLFHSFPFINGPFPTGNGKLNLHKSALSIEREWHNCQPLRMGVADQTAPFAPTQQELAIMARVIVHLGHPSWCVRSNVAILQEDAVW
jgi:hypothetical protein